MLFIEIDYRDKEEGVGFNVHEIGTMQSDGKRLIYTEGDILRALRQVGGDVIIPDGVTEIGWGAYINLVIKNVPRETLEFERRMLHGYIRVAVTAAAWAGGN